MSKGGLGAGFRRDVFVRCGLIDHGWAISNQLSEVYVRSRGKDLLQLDGGGVHCFSYTKWHVRTSESHHGGGKALSRWLAHNVCLSCLQQHPLWKGRNTFSTVCSSAGACTWTLEYKEQTDMSTKAQFDYLFKV